MQLPQVHLIGETIDIRSLVSADKLQHAPDFRLFERILATSRFYRLKEREVSLIDIELSPAQTALPGKNDPEITIGKPQICDSL